MTNSKSLSWTEQLVQWGSLSPKYVIYWKANGCFYDPLRTGEWSSKQDDGIRFDSYDEASDLVDSWGVSAMSKKMYLDIQQVYV